ncbi:unnamed protein product, partial [marine sediment metagenome]
STKENIGYMVFTQKFMVITQGQMIDISMQTP